MLDKILIPAEYVYLPDWPAGCRGARYLAHRMVTDVPSYQSKILIECLDGPDAGRWITCTPANFASRYAPAAQPEEPQPAEPPVEKAAGHAAEPWRTGV